MRGVGREVRAGLLVFAFFLAMGAWTILGQLPEMPPPGGRWVVQVSEVLGLKKSDEVWLRGMAVGRVGRVDLAPGDVRVHLYMNTPLEFHEGYQVWIKPLTFFGGTYVELDLGDPQGPVVPLGTLLAGRRAILVGEAGKKLFSTVPDTMPRLWADTKTIRRGWQGRDGSLRHLLDAENGGAGAALKAEWDGLKADYERIKSELDPERGSVFRFSKELGSKRWRDLRDQAEAIRAAYVQDEGSLPKFVGGALNDQARSAFAALTAVRAASSRVRELFQREDGSWGQFRNGGILYRRLRELKASFAAMKEHFQARRGSALRLAYDQELRRTLKDLGEMVKTASEDYARYYMDTTIFGQVLIRSGVGTGEPGPLGRAAGATK